MRRTVLERFQRCFFGTTPKGGLLARLRGNVAGNTLAMMAIALIPLLFIAGSAIDTARLYMVKNRLQQACDAGALAGRRFMLSSSSTTLDANATTQANAFFSNNFKLGLFGTKSVTFTPSKTSENQVAGTATATVPMTLTGMMGFRDQALTVNCEARYDVADTDIMFVLDTTGSMACLASDTNGCNPVIYSYTRPSDPDAPDYGGTGYASTEKSGSKISGLRQAVLNFYDTLAAAVDPATHLRYGFVTYTSTVNAGYAVTAVSPDYIVNSWTYNSRRLAGDANTGTAKTSTDSSKNASKCNAYSVRSPVTGYTTSGSATRTYGTWDSSNNSCTITEQPLKPKWTYEKVTYDTSQYKLGNTVADPTKVTGATSRWLGCLEERDTTASSSFDYANLPYDLNPDFVPSSDATRWRPMWPDVVYYRGNNSSVTYSGNSSNPLGDDTTGNYYPVMAVAANGQVSCGKPAKRLRTMTRTDVSNYVNAADFVPMGGTYHDTGMIWGTRLLSPTGIFSNDTGAWPGRNPPKRYIVFMTDGDMQPSMCLYGMYGIENYDKRVANVGYQSSCSSSTQLNNHYARFLAACAAAKARNISIFVVGFGQTLTSQLTQCATPGQAFYAANNASLDAAFQTIAKRVAMLRVSK
ncbi:von Willebrand factor type A domain-containing protein [Sphingomonas sp. NFR04]|uniref:TadE/TadG family type IV pilus assembly protein n=1 Tax=Sphingomonas sp. NFR04 TaxID=1566283 RepID=UPI0008F02BD4|nr:TadE/TadG family type IV pilus assembly protein [Sphingomonas sp. NFR04]SFJ56620.1 von Willebrand factor type A domain-containing protein [Sphingomonas sp. NFR04]